jgi:hypothetical protein
MSQFELSADEGRFFGLDMGDWSMMLGGSVMITLIALLL